MEVLILICSFFSFFFTFIMLLFFSIFREINPQIIDLEDVESFIKERN